MSFRIIRTAAASAVIAGAVASILVGTASAETVTVHARGTGQQMPSQSVVQTPDGVVVENNYPAEIAPLPGHTHPYNGSLNDGDRKGFWIARKYAKPGDAVICDGYSLGGEVAGDTCDELSREGAPYELTTETNSDPRLRGTGVAVVMKQYTDMLPFDGYPLVHFRGERSSVGKVQYHGTCAMYDLICNAADPAINPLGFAAGFVGYLTGQHDYSNVDKYPTRVLTYDGGYTVITEVDKGNPLVKIGDQVSQVVNGEPLTTPQADLIEALSPAPTPGSREQVAPDVAQAAPTVGDVAAEAYKEYTPKVVNAVVDAGVTQATGNPVLGDAAGTVAEQVAEPIVAQTAPIVQAGVAAATTSLATGDASAINGFVNGLVPGASLPTH